MNLAASNQRMATRDQQELAGVGAQLRVHLQEEETQAQFLFLMTTKRWWGIHLDQ
jgi:hypothetical protein